MDSKKAAIRIAASIDDVVQLLKTTPPNKHKLNRLLWDLRHIENVHQTQEHVLRVGLRLDVYGDTMAKLMCAKKTIKKLIAELKNRSYHGNSDE